VVHLLRPSLTTMAMFYNKQTASALSDGMRILDTRIKEGK